MSYRFIVNPKTNRKVSVDGRLGKQIVNQYLKQSGGANSKNPLAFIRAQNKKQKLKDDRSMVMKRLKRQKSPARRAPARKSPARRAPARSGKLAAARGAAAARTAARQGKRGASAAAEQTRRLARTAKKDAAARRAILAAIKSPGKSSRRKGMSPPKAPKRLGRIGAIGSMAGPLPAKLPKLGRKRPGPPSGPPPTRRRPGPPSGPPPTRRRSSQLPPMAPLPSVPRAKLPKLGRKRPGPPSGPPPTRRRPGPPFKKSSSGTTGSRSCKLPTVQRRFCPNAGLEANLRQQCDDCGWFEETGEAPPAQGPGCSSINKKFKGEGGNQKRKAACNNNSACVWKRIGKKASGGRKKHKCHRRQ